jgi:hypothetical protein
MIALPIYTPIVEAPPKVFRRLTPMGREDYLVVNQKKNAIFLLKKEDYFDS